MLTFPTLKTGASVQYPFTVSESYATDVLQFLAGDEQRYLTTPGALRKWSIELDLLDEAELRSIEEFFIAASGSYETFSFTDPASGTSHPNCFITGDSLQEQFSGDRRAGMILIIQEGRA